MKTRNALLSTALCVASGLVGPQAMAQLPNLPAGYGATLSPGFLPSVPTTSDPTKTVDYSYLWIGDSAGSATCSYVAGNAYGYTMEIGHIGSTVVKDRSVAEFASHSAADFCGGPVSINEESGIGHNNFGVVDYQDPFDIVNGGIGYAYPYASTTGSTSGAWGYMDVLIASCPNGSSYSYTSGWCDCSGTTFPYKLNSAGCSVYMSVSVHLNAGYGNSPPSLPSPANVSVLANNEVATVTIDAQDGAGDESASDNASFLITRTGPTTSSCTVSFSKSGTATAPPSSGYDYTINGSTSVSSVTIPAGYSSVVVTIAPRQDCTSEATETVIFTLTTATGCYVPPSSSATVEISD